MMKKPEDELRLAIPDEEPEGPLLVAANITRLRSQRGWSEAVLAAKVGLTEAELARHLQGTETPPLELMWKIANVLRVPVATLLRPLRQGL
jgi:transcriptional regulator with XRE-family HTH domain